MSFLLIGIFVSLSLPGSKSGNSLTGLRRGSSRGCLQGNCKIDDTCLWLLKVTFLGPLPFIYIVSPLSNLPN